VHTPFKLQLASVLQVAEAAAALSNKPSAAMHARVKIGAMTEKRSPPAGYILE
jgi:hypothetical protein